MKYSLTNILILLLGTVQAQIFDEVLKANIDDQIYRYVETTSPGIAVGIVQNGNIVYENYSGLSNLENKININENTSFNIASNAKQFTALCILKLVHDGKIKLDDDIRNYLPELYKNHESKISIKHLLTHSSGIRDVYDLWALKGQTWWELFIDNNDALELIKSQTDLNFAPGTEHLYSNSNYILLTEIVKVVSNTKFADFSLELFDELGMEQTSFLTNYMSVIPNKARPYGNWNGWKEYPVVTETHGDGALFTTLKDQLKWEIIIQNPSKYPILKDIVNQSQAPISSSNNTDYGHGLMFGEYKGLNYAYHDGSTGAYNATFLRFPDKHTAFVVMSNNGNVPTNYLAKQLVDICFNMQNMENSAFPAGPDKVDEFPNFSEIVGSYKTAGGTLIKILETDGELYREIYQRDPVKLINEKGNLFHYATNEDLKIAFTKDESDQWIFTIYLSSQEPNIGTKLPSAEIDKSYFTTLNGIYFNDETDTEIEIKYLQDHTYSIIKNGRERKGELTVIDFLRMNSYQISISRDNNDNVNGLIVKNGRIDNVRFDKR